MNPPLSRADGGNSSGVTIFFTGFLGAAFAFVQACGVGAGYVTPNQPSGGPQAGETTVFSLYLIGDAGYAGEDNSAPLDALCADAARAPERSFVAVLGDNIYPAGLAEAGSPDRARGESVLDRQIGAITGSGASGVFLSGNHDWDHMGEDGEAAVIRQQEYISGRTGGAVRLMPPNAEPGPAVLLENERVQIIAIETQWWIHRGRKPFYPGAGRSDPAADSSADSPADPEAVTMGLIADSLRRLLRSYDGGLSIVLGHHPLETHGPHGGFFTWKDHLFPLTGLENWIWLPLPFIGSAYPVARMTGAIDQDQSHERYKTFISRIESAITLDRPVLFASGHEHSLQVIRPDENRLYLVSGNGITDHSEPVSAGENTLFASEIAGYMRIDFYESGSSRLIVIGIVDDGTEPVELFSCWIIPPDDSR